MEDSEDEDDSDDNEGSNDDDEDDVDSDGNDDEDEKRAATSHIYTVLSDFKAEQEGDLSVQVKYFSLILTFLLILNCHDFVFYVLRS